MMIDVGVWSLTSCCWGVRCERVNPRQVCWIGIRSRFIIRVDVDTAATTNTTTTTTTSRRRSARTSFSTPTDAGAWVVLRHGDDGLRTPSAQRRIVAALLWIGERLSMGT